MASQIRNNVSRIILWVIRNTRTYGRSSNNSQKQEVKDVDPGELMPYLVQNKVNKRENVDVPVKIAGKLLVCYYVSLNVTSFEYAPIIIETIRTKRQDPLLNFITNICTFIRHVG